MWESLNGKKAYLVSAAALAYAWLGVFLGHATPADAMQLTWEALMTATLRHGISKV